MAKQSGLLCLRRGRNVVFCPGAGGLELGSQGKWGLGPERAEVGPGWGTGIGVSVGVLGQVGMGSLKRSCLTFIANCLCGAGMQVLHLCKPLAESVSTGLSSNDHLDALEQKAWAEHKPYTNSGWQKD